MIARSAIAASLLALMAPTASQAQEATISPFSGKPVPRFETLKFSAVHGRIGPSLDHPIAWRYERAGLPVKIIKESQQWRRIRDHDGDEVWVHARMLSDAKHVLTQAETPLRKAPKVSAHIVATVEAGVLSSVLSCQSGWCQVTADDHKGWLPMSALWGSD